MGKKLMENLLKHWQKNMSGTLGTRPVNSEHPQETQVTSLKCRTTDTLNVHTTRKDKNKQL